MRLLYCNVCRSVDEVPDYEGPEKVDPLVEKVLMKHNLRDPMAHGGQSTLPFRLAQCSTEDWMMHREVVLKRLNEDITQCGFPAWMGESHNTFIEDAHQCWRKHRWPKEGQPCLDYWSESKRIGRPTEEGRRALKDNYKLGPQDPHLCQWCPYHTVVTTEKRHRRGMYKER